MKCLRLVCLVMVVLFACAPALWADGLTPLFWEDQYISFFTTDVASGVWQIFFVDTTTQPDTYTPLTFSSQYNGHSVGDLLSIILAPYQSFINNGGINTFQIYLSGNRYSVWLGTTNSPTTWMKEEYGFLNGTQVPEPATITLLLTGAAAVGLKRFRRRA